MIREAAAGREAEEIREIDGKRTMIRKAVISDLKEILAIYAGARKFMADHGNAGQWGNHYPPAEMIEADIMAEKLYVIERGEKPCGVFYFAVEEDPTYGRIDNGSWKSEEPYGVIHKVAAAEGERGIVAECVSWCKARIGHLRIDTHEDNLVMQRAVAGQGFTLCGTVYVGDGSPRLAYEMV